MHDVIWHKDQKSGCWWDVQVVSLEGPTVTDASLEETLQAALAELPEGLSIAGLALGIVTDAGQYLFVAYPQECVQTCILGLKMVASFHSAI